MKVTLAQTNPKLSRINLEDSVRIIEEYIGKTELIVFPELSLSGYLLQDKLLEDGWNVDEFTVLEKLSLHVDIVVGCAVREDEYFTNSALYFSGGKLVSKHNKVHLPNYGMFEEARYFEGGNKFESFELNNSKISMVICEDLWHKEVHKSLIAENPDLIIALVASPARGFYDNGLEIQNKWYEIIKTVAKECKAKLVFVNRVGFEDGLGFWGGSCVVNEDANIVHQLPLFKETIKTVEV